MFRVLDLFAGVGGSAKGIQKYLDRKSIDYEYLAVDNNYQVLLAHSYLNEDSIPELTDAWDWNNFYNFDFIWASPPCTSHSRLNMYMNRKNPDMRLWEFIWKLQQQQTPFVVENVEPYYKTPIKPTLKISRHCFWSNKPIISFKVPGLPKDFERMTIKDWEKHHEINPGVTEHIKDRLERRQQLRNMVHWTISYNIIEQILFPKQKQLEVA